MYLSGFLRGRELFEPDQESPTLAENTNLLPAIFSFGFSVNRLPLFVPCSPDLLFSFSLRPATITVWFLFRAMSSSFSSWYYFLLPSSFQHSLSILPLPTIRTDLVRSEQRIQ
jgi:hypothetical protein